MTTIIKATTNTFLKTEAKQASELKDNQKASISKDTSLELAKIEGLDTNHWEVELKEPIENFLFLKGFVFSPHWGIVKSDKPEIQKETYNKPKKTAIDRQLNRLSAYLPAGQKLDLNVKTTFFSQRDNYTQPHRTCNSSSNAMYLDWLLATTKKNRLNTDNDYLKKIISKGDSTSHEVQTRTIQEYGFNTKWVVDADYDFVEDLIETGFPVVVNILHRGTIKAPRGGHVILLIGRKATSWIAHDPYGTLTSDYQNTNGAFSIIPENEFKIRWQGGYRILA